MEYEQIETEAGAVERRLLEGDASCLADEDLLKLLFGTRIAPDDLVRMLIEPRARPSAWPEGPFGLSPQLAAAFELARRRYAPHGRRIRCASDVHPIVSHLATAKQEIVMAISLSGAHEVIAARVVTVGLLNRCQLHPREVFSDPLKDRAASLILCHNHPSGSLEASNEDVKLTRQLAEAGEMLGIPLIDHLIVGGQGISSMREAGYLDYVRTRGAGKRRK